jgi:hypothetical protein
VLTAVAVATFATACGTTVHGSAGAAADSVGPGLSVPTTAPSSDPGRPGPSLPGPANLSVPGTATAPGPAAIGPQTTTSAGPGTGAARTTGPIKVGFMYAINDAAASAGVDNNTSINAGNVMHALVASYNRQGGFAGRRIDPVYASMRSSSNDFEGDLAAACATLTQDNHVAAVFSTVGIYSESFYACLAKAGVPVISGDVGPDRYDAQAFPLLVTPDSMLGDTRVMEVVDRLNASGWLTTRDRMGVVIEDCPVNHRIYANSLAPELKRLGIAVAATVAPHCFQSISDLGSISAEMGSAVVQFRQRGVTKVIFVSQAQEGTMTYEFMLAAGNQGWYPGYAMSSASDATIQQGQGGVPKREFSNARGVGWMPPLDSIDRGQWTTTATTRTCLARVRAEGLRPSTAIDDIQVETVCDTFVLYDAALRTTHGNDSAAVVQQGLRTAGTRFSSAAALSGSVGFWDHGRLAPAQGRMFEYVSSRGGFVYAGRPFRFAD